MRIRGKDNMLAERCIAGKKLKVSLVVSKVRPMLAKQKEQGKGK
jgi:hypothetical protein